MLSIKITKLMVIATFAVLIPAVSYAVQNAGFVDGIWFSMQNPIEGESINIFAAVQNQTDSPTSGTVTFYDAGKSIGTSNFSIQPNSIQSASIKYTLTSGEHPISVRITGSSLTYTTLPVRTIFAKAAPPPKITSPKEEHTASTVASDVISSISNMASSSAAQTIIDTASVVASSTSKTGTSVFASIDPKAQKIAKQLKRKSAQLMTPKKVATSAIDTTPTSKGPTRSTVKDDVQKPTRLHQMAAVGLSVLAFAFHNWLWHIIVAISLVILRAIYRNRIN